MTSPHDYYGVKAISNSSLSLINPNQGGSPKKFKKYIIDQDGEKVESPSLKNGKMIHLYVENPDLFVVAEATRPSDMLAEWVERVHKLTELNEDEIVVDNQLIKAVALQQRGTAYSNIKDEGKVWAKFQEGLEYLKELVKVSGKQILSASEKQILEGCVKALKENTSVWNMLYSPGDDITEFAYAEHEMFWPYEYTKGEFLQLKGMIDKVRIIPEKRKIIIIDFKTTSKPISMYADSFIQYHTYRQLAMYRIGLKETLREKYEDIDEWEFESYIIAQETFGLFENCLYKIPIEWYKEGIFELNQLLKMVVWHTINDDWVNTAEEKKFGFRTLYYVTDSGPVQSN